MLMLWMWLALEKLGFGGLSAPTADSNHLGSFKAHKPRAPSELIQPESLETVFRSFESAPDDSAVQAEWRLLHPDPTSVPSASAKAAKPQPQIVQLSVSTLKPDC